MPLMAVPNLLHRRPWKENRAGLSVNVVKSETATRERSVSYFTVVLEQGVVACPLSVELWTFYVDFSKERYKGTVAGEGRIREIYERAIAAVGLDFKSDELWDVYAQWERSLGQHRNVVGIYERLIRIPTLHYRRHFDELQQSLLVASVKELISAEEYETLLASVPEKESMELMFGQEKMKGEDAEAFVRNMAIESRRTLYKETEKEASKRWAFEENIRRPYFHVRPLENNQLKNWNDYLDFEIAEGQQNRIVFLFERCLVACALYEDFWRKYIGYLTIESLTDYIRYAYQRVCTYHLPSKTGLHLDWATFEEMQGNIAGATAALQNGLRHLPNKAILSLRQLGLTRRTRLREASSNAEDVKADSDAITEAVQEQYAKIINEAEDAGLAEFFLLKQAQYWLKMKGDKDKAMEILRAGLKLDPTSIPVLTALIDCELHQIPLNLPAVAALFDEITEMEQLNPDQKAEFLERKICFLEDFSTDVREIAAAHQRYYELNGKTTRGRKRGFGEVDVEDGLSDGVPPAGAKHGAPAMHGQFPGPGLMQPPAGTVPGYFPPPTSMPAPMMAGGWPAAAPPMAAPGYPAYGASTAHAPAWPGYGAPQQQHHAPPPAWNYQAAVS
ncbi:hypothetical protein RvY_04447-2 [Ramazzottius varieornatus]|uniref:Suppressor of forked domain-containing protein n=1 Tax=Ramazzottius varieornatus TaxID=947166 RepID=A0A1D1URM7_RAMVA|nr:hypothetical protein RvY_04447-2 [Ramazzottius varieornatus]